MRGAAPNETSHSLARSAFALGGHDLRNRICMPAHSYGFTNDSVGVRAAAAYVGRRLSNGVAMVIVGEAEVPFGDRAARGEAPSRLAGAASTPLYRALADLTNAHGGVVLEQLYHPGGQVWYEERRQAVAPSSVPQAISYLVPRALELAEIEALTASFAAAAGDVVSCGLQGVELKADQGKLHHQFLSRRYNLRDDDHGGAIANRARFLVECLEAMRSAVGSEAILGVRLPGPVTSPRGGDAAVWSDDVSTEELIEIAKIVERTRFADYISISGETNSTAWGYARNHGDGSVPRMTFREFSQTLRQEVELPLLLTGKILSLDDAETLLTANACDIVGMARALIADGDMLTTAWQMNRPDLVRPCIGCNIACVGRTWQGQSVRCALDPTSGREDLGIPRPSHNARIAVVGGGPAGLAFAAAASEFGSAVDLFERETRLGGQLMAWSQLPDRHGVLAAVDHWYVTLHARGVGIVCGAPAPPWAELLQNYDHVIDATGGTIPERPTNKQVRQFDAVSAIAKKGDWSGIDAIVFDANRHSDAAGVALLLRERGASVKVLSPFEYVGIGTDPVTYSNRIGALRSAEIATLPLSDLLIGPNGVEILDHSRNVVELDASANCLVWCVNNLPMVASEASGNEQVTTPRMTAIGERSGVAGLEGVVRHAYDCARALLCKVEDN